MDPSHRYFLSLGSNIQPDENLTRAITRLREHGKIDAVSSVWESEPIGSTGPNFLNLCLSIRSPLEPDEFRALVTRNIEAQMGRVRGSDRSAPRTIDPDNPTTRTPQSTYTHTLHILVLLLETLKAPLAA